MFTLASLKAHAYRVRHAAKREAIARIFTVSSLLLAVATGIPVCLSTCVASAQTTASAYPLGVASTIPSMGNQIDGVAVDAVGDVFVANYGTGTIVKNTYNAAAGTYSSAVIVNFGHISAIAVSADGTNVFFSGFDGTLQTVMRYTGSGTSYASAGNALGTNYGAQNFALALDGSQNLYIAYNQTIEKLHPASNYSAGSATLLANGAYNAPTYIAIAADATGSNIYALTNNPGYSTDLLNHLNGSGTVLSSVSVPVANNIVVDAGQNVFLGSANGTISKVTPAGNIVTAAINATASGRTSTSNSATPVAVDAAGSLYIGTVGSSVRKYTPVSSFGSVAVGANSNSVAVVFTVSGTAASSSVLTQGQANLDFASTGNGLSCGAAVNGVETCTVYVVFNPVAPGLRSGAVNLLDANNNVLGTAIVSGTGTGALAVITPGTISTVAGSGATAISGDGGSPTAAGLASPSQVIVDALGDQFVVTANTVREISAGTGNITTIAGVAGQQGYTGDGGLATAATFNGLTGIALDGAGNLYIADQNNNAIRVVNAATGIVSTLFTTSATSGNYPISVTFSAAGDLYVGTTSAILKYSIATGALTTFAGTPGSAGTSGDGGAATAGQVAYIYSLAFDATGDLLFLSGGSNVAVRQISPAGILSTVVPFQSGVTFEGLAVDPAGDVFLANASQNTILKFAPATAATTLIAGSGAGGDGSAATAASLNYPNTLAFDGNGDLYIADLQNNRIRMVSATAAPFTFPGINPVTSPATTAATTDTVTFSNQGNIPLTLTNTGGTNPGLGAPFFLGNGSGSCVSVSSTPMTVAAGTSCTETISFTPTTAGNPVYGQLTFTDNSDNPSSIDQQAVYVAAEAYVPIVTTTTVAVSPSTNLQQGTSVTLTATVTAADGSAPTGSLQFYDNGTTVGSPIAAGSAYTLADTLTAGEHDFTATFTGTQFDLNSNSAVDTVIAAPLTAVGTPATAIQQTVKITTGGTFGSVVALTQGVAGLDFNTAATTCTGALSVGQACSVTYNFTPRFPGQKLGALEMLDGSGNILGSALISGTGNGPQAILYSGTKNPLVATVHNGTQVTIDAAGNLYYINNYSNTVLKETLANGTYTESTVLAGLASPRDLFVDGAGAVYISDLSAQTLTKMTPSATGYVPSTLPITLTGAFAVDSMGDIFFINTNSALQEAAPNGSGGYTTTSLADGSYSAFAMAVAANGDLFVAEYTPAQGTGTGDIAKYVHGTYQRHVLANSESLIPNAIALNPDGSLYVSDSIHQEVVRLTPPTSGYRYTATTIDTTTLPGGVTVGGNGDLYVNDNATNNIVQFDVVTAPTLTFATTIEGNTSTDSPRSITLSNVGNQPLNFVTPTAGSNPSVSANFTTGSSSTCNTATPYLLAPGASCTEAFSFTPAATGNITGAAVTSDNSLNVANATQTIHLAGASDLSTTTALVIAAATPTLTTTSVTLTATITASDASNSVGSVIFYDGSTVLQTVAVSGGKAVYTLNLSAAVHSLSAVYSATLPYTGSQAAAQTLKVYGTPIGNLDTVENLRDNSTTLVYGDTLFVSGWAADPTDGSPITVYVTLDGSRIAATTGGSRPDVAAYFNNPSYTNSGYTLSFPASHLSVGSHTVGVIILNQGGVTQTFRTVTINVLGAAPTGNVDNVQGTTSQTTRLLQGDTLFVSGWAGDPNPANGASVASVSILIDGKAYAATLNQSRPDVASYTGESGYAHSGYTFSLADSSLTPGQHTIGVTATGATGLTTTFATHTITVLAQAPTIYIDTVDDPITGNANNISQQDNLYVSGWAADYQTPGNVSDVSIYIDGNLFGHATLGQSRPDVANYLNNQAYANAGWVLNMSAASIPVGQHTVTAVATDHAGLTTTTPGYTIGVNNYAQKAKQAPQQ